MAGTIARPSCCVWDNAYCVSGRPETENDRSHNSRIESAPGAGLRAGHGELIRRACSTVLCLAALALLPVVAEAQTGGFLAKEVTDDTGGVLPGVAVEASSPALIATGWSEAILETLPYRCVVAEEVSLELQAGRRTGRGEAGALNLETWGISHFAGLVGGTAAETADGGLDLVRPRMRGATPGRPATVDCGSGDACENGFLHLTVGCTADARPRTCSSTSSSRAPEAAIQRMVVRTRSVLSLGINRTPTTQWLREGTGRQSSVANTSRKEYCAMRSVTFPLLAAALAVTMPPATTAVAAGQAARAAST